MKWPERLSARDAAIMHFVSERGFTHAGTLAVIEDDLPFEEYCQDLSRRILALPRFRQIPVRVPLNLAYPTWEYDPRFNFADHVEYQRLDSPGTWQQLLDLASRLYAIRLPGDRPPWFIYLIGGLEGNRSALLVKVHHAITDGVGAEKLIPILYGADMPAAEGPLPPNVPAVPTAMKQIGLGLRDNALTGLRVAARIPSNTLGLIRWLASKDAREAIRLQLDYLRAKPIRLPFHSPCSGNLRFVTTRFDLEEIRTIGRACNATVNDVLLAIIARAVQSYAQLRQIDTTRRTLRVQMPVNMRDERVPRNMGNIATIAAVPIPLDLTDPLDLVRTISRRTSALKRCNAPLAIHRAIGGILFCLTPMFAPIVQRRAASLKSQRKTFRNGNAPGTSLVVSNVPRRPMPHYVAGRPLSMRYALGSPAPHVGIGSVAMTFGKYLGVTITANAEGARDLGELLHLVEVAFKELQTAADSSFNAP